MNVLVTGGAGFIGSHIVDRLIADGHNVIVIDDLSTGKKENINKKALFVEADLKTWDLNAISMHIDAVMHIAGNASVVKGFSDIGYDIHTNLEMTARVLDFVVSRKISKLLYASSMTVYNDRADEHPVSYYGAAKLAAENFIKITANRKDLGFKLKTTVFRMFNVYGPRQDLSNPYQGVLAIFLGKLLNAEPIKIFGDGNQVRDFIYIDDVVDAWIKELNIDHKFHVTIDLGSGIAVTMRTLISMIAKEADLTPMIEYLPAREGDLRGFACIDPVFDTRRLSDGLKETVKWAKNKWQQETYL